MKRRIFSLDIIRVIAILLVVVLHSLENTWCITEPVSASTLTRLGIIIIYSIGRISVPLFLFLTGYLMLDKEYDKEATSKFYRCNLARILIATIVWTVIYYITNVCNGKISFSPIALIRSVLFVNQGTVSTHLWYMPMIIGLYLFIPFIANGLRCIDEKYNKYIKLIAIVSVLYLFCLPTANSVIQAFGKSQFINNLNLSYVGGCYGFLMLLGWYVKRFKITDNKVKFSNRLLATASVLSLLLMFAINYIVLYLLHRSYTLWYDSLPLMIASVAIFIMLLRAFSGFSEKALISEISKSVFGIYLSHMLFINIIVDIANASSIEYSWLRFVMIVFFAIICSTIFFVLMKNLKGTRAGCVSRYLGF